MDRYYQPEDTNTPPDEKHVPKSSSDPCLTAFAQLGALRLRTKRGIITLSTGTTEFIIAESGQALSLQQDDDVDDKLWHGVGTFRCPTSTHVTIGTEVVNHFCRTGDQYLVINDLTQDDVYKDKCVVKEDPHVTFLAAVPLRTPHSNIIIGNYVIVDDKPREEGLTDSEIQFIMDMGVTVMDYLQAGLVKRKQYRAERMIKAISLFIEGKSTLRDWWLEWGHKFQQPTLQKRAKSGAELAQLADHEFGVQEPVANLSKGLDGFTGADSPLQTPSSSAPSRAGHDFGDGRPMLPRGESHATSGSETTGQTTLVSRSWHDRNSSVTTFDTLTEPTTVDHPESRQSVSFDLPPHQLSADVSKELQDALLSSDLKGVFSRASNLIREAIGVEGVVFFDASVGSFGGSVSAEEKAPGAFQTEHGHTSSDDEHRRRQSVADIDLHEQTASDSARSEPVAEKGCSILGYSTRRRSSLRGHQPAAGKGFFPESMLRRLLKRYPHGKGKPTYLSSACLGSGRVFETMIHDF